MLPIKTLAFIAGLVSAAAVTVPAYAQDDIVKHLISNPNVGSWEFYGQQLTNKKYSDPAVQGGTAVEATATGVGNAYDAAGQVEVNQKIMKGDHIMCAVWLKAKTPPTTTLHSRLQINSAPYTALTETDFQITDQWKLYTMEVDADKDYDKGKVVFTVQLNGAKQTVDLGPAFVLNMTRTY